MRQCARQSVSSRNNAASSRVAAFQEHTMATESPAGELGVAAPAFSLPTTDGRMLTLDDVRGKRGLVVVFMCNHCPYVKGALPHLVRDAKDLPTLASGVAPITSNDSPITPPDPF